MEYLKIVKKYLTQAETEIHTFSLPSENSHKIVIKGLLNSITKEEVTEELKELG